MANGVSSAYHEEVGGTFCKSCGNRGFTPNQRFEAAARRRRRKLQLANHWSTMPTLQQALERTFLAIKELFGSPLNCSMSCGISYCSAFPEDDIFGAITDSFLYR